eukprot:gene9750-9908_t
MLAQRFHLKPFVAAPCQQRVSSAARPRLTSRGHQQQQHRIVCSAAAGGASQDPYKVLGVPPDADQNTINRAYSQKKYAARGNDTLTQQIEAAHSALMMNALAARMKLAITAYGFQGPNMSKVIASMLVGIAGNVLKQNAISPPPKDPSMATEEEAGRAPEYLGGSLKALSLPPTLTGAGFIVSMKIAGAAICNWIMTSFYY